MPHYAFFDFDGTLTRTDTVLPFVRYVAQNDAVYWRKLLQISPYLLGYLSGCVSNLVAKEKVFTAFLANMPSEIAQNKADDFARFRLPELLLPAGMAKLAQHRERGDICVLVSASPELYLHTWAAQHGFACVLGTRLQVVSGCLNGKVAGENCIGAEKVARIEAEFGAECWTNSVAYSDSRVDLPMLQRATQGFLLHKGEFVSLNTFSGCLK
ncbi:HAD family hydrolase [Wielerella bovis]|uniref:HAD family hydrolase n=1 Tax=Wielerella bovis TaxID=2917790 RepID=UPI0020198B99|nr:HAD family hydrolase [Wielerella bovis]ULJ64644.1 HAD-IB family hydrolase [Wielerella bovis]ULJ66916.1 HAD-IB family hydrolase [Wielerella bovis]